MCKREVKVTERKRKEIVVEDEEEAEEEEWCYRTTKFILGILLAAASSGPLLCVMTQQVCVSKCLLVRRLPRLNADLDNVLLVVVFIFYATLNYLVLCGAWLLFRNALRSVYLRCRSTGAVSMPRCVENWILMDPKTTRSGKVYGYRKAKYIISDTDGDSCCSQD